jgi:hypothetical protein
MVGDEDPAWQDVSPMRRAFRGRLAWTRARNGAREGNAMANQRDVDPNQAPGGQNKPNSEGGKAGRVSGDRNTDNHPGFNDNDAKAGRTGARSEDDRED